MDTRQNDRTAEQQRKRAPQTGKTRSGSAPASNAQRRPGTAAPKRRPASRTKAPAAKASVPRKSDSLTDTRRRTQKKKSGILNQLKRAVADTSSRAKREEAARAAKLKARKKPSPAAGSPDPPGLPSLWCIPSPRHSTCTVCCCS